MNIIKKVIFLILYMIEDFFILIKNQEMCDLYEMYQIVLFGLLINASYGVMHNEINFSDIIIVVFSTYGIMRFRKDIKDNQC